MILEIDIGIGFVPVACLTSVTESDTAQTIGTTVRQNGGWRTSRPVSQGKTISIDGLLPTDVALFSWEDLAQLKRNATKFSWRIEAETGFGYIESLNLEGTIGSDVSFSAEIINTGKPIDSVPSGYTVAFFNDPFTQTTYNWRFTGAEIGATYSFQVVSSGGGTPINGGGTVTSETQQFFSQPLAGLNAGELTIAFFLTNGQGAGAIVTDTAQYSPGATVPTISIGPPVPTTVTAGTAIEFLITYGGADAITLSSGDVSLTTTGTATSPIQITGSGLTERTVRLFNPTGNGTIRINIASGTATNTIGSAPSAGPSDAATVQVAAPSGYVLAWNNNPILSNTPGLTLTGGNGLGTGITGVITSSGGGSPVNVNETFGSTPYGFTVNVATLPDGQLTANLTVTGPGGTQTITPPPTTSKGVATPITIAVSAPVPSLVAAQGTSIKITVTYTGADTITLAPGDITLTSTQGSTSADIAVTGSGTTSRLVTLSNVTGVGNIAISVAAGTATNGSGSSAPAGATVPGEECRVVADFVVPSAVMPELLAYVSAIEQTGGQGSSVTTITDGAGNLTGITTDGITVNIRTNGNPEFDFTGTSSHINLGTPSVLNFVPFVDDWTALIIVGTAKGPSSTTFYAQGDRATGLGYQSLFYAGFDNLYPFLFRNNPPSGWANLTTGIGNDAIAQTAEGAVTSTEFRAYQDGTELGASPKFIVATASNWADPWIIGAEQDSSDGSGFIPGSVYDGQLQAVMFFGKVLTPAEMIAIRDDILNQ